MSNKTEWTQKGSNDKLHASGPKKPSGTKNGDKKSDYTEAGLFKALIALAAGVIVAALAKGVKDSDYFD